MKVSTGGLRLEPGASRIAGRTEGGWIVGNRLYQPALLVSAAFAGTIPNLSLRSLDSVTLPDLDGVELLLLGTGGTLLRPSAAFTQACGKRGWRVEPMDSAAAARTFNVLVAEERQVAALIL